jgi:acyl-CoA synthetase (AMP-forming)/AMP-acid ligase II/acyl carrier protein
LKFTNFVDVLKYKAKTIPNNIAFSIIKDDNCIAESISFSELDKKAGNVAEALKNICNPGDRVILIFPSGIDFIYCLLGCLYSHVISVPIYPPRNQKNNPESIIRFKKIINDARPKVILTNETLLRKYEHLITETSDQCKWLTVEESICKNSEYIHPNIHENTPAIIQYTSGSTGHPRGVLLKHGSLLRNAVNIQNAFSVDENTIALGWLPFYHDMGLMGLIFQPIFLGCHSILMSPASFIQKPIKWLRALSHFKATVSGAPNFAYEICSQIEDKALFDGLDLSNWKIAFCGAEPIKPDTLEKFAKICEPFGFRTNSFLPTYGLAEATLYASGKREPEELFKTFNVDSLENNRVLFVDDHANSPLKTRKLVNLGVSPKYLKIKVVNPETHVVCASDQVGEIWLSGPSVASGYWNAKEETNKIFKARLTNSKRSWLKTGDLGFVYSGELYICGRLKDVIIIKGRNHYPQDIAETVQLAYSSSTINSCAVFAVEINGEESLIIIQEVSRHSSDFSLSSIANKIIENISLKHGIKVFDLLFVKNNTIPKTSSGKIRLTECKLLYQFHNIDFVYRNANKIQNNSELIKTETTEKNNAIEDRILLISKKIFKQVEINKNDNFFIYGLDSILAIQLLETINSEFNINVSLEDAFNNPTISDLAQVVTNYSNNSVALL